MSTVFLHDDNLGPAARYATHVTLTTAGEEVLLLRREPPTRISTVGHDAVADAPDFLPNGMVVATHPEIRVSGIALARKGEEIARLLVQGMRGASVRIVSGFQLMRAKDYLGRHLDGLLPSLRVEVRRAFLQRVAPLSLYVGVVRLSVLRGAEPPVPLVEVLYDTTDNSMTMSAFAHVVLHPKIARYVEILRRREHLGEPVDAVSGGPVTIS